MNEFKEIIREEKIGFIVDLHGRNNNPIARMDNYPEAILKKVEYVLNENNLIFFTGDIFNTYLTGVQFINKLLLLLMKAQVQGKVIKMIVGNHDIVGRDYSSYLNTSLGTLVIGRNWLLTEPYAPLGFEVVPFTFDEEGNPKISMKGEYDINYKDVRILLGHAYFNHPEFNDKWNIDAPTLEGFDYCVLGHDHQKYEPQEFPWELEDGTSGICTLLRSGSISRQTIDDKDWKIQYPQITLKWYHTFGKPDTQNSDRAPDEHTFEYKDIPFAPAEEVFKLVDTSGKDLAQHRKNIDRMIELLQVENTDDELSLNTILSEINCPQKYKDIINEVLRG